MFSFTKKMFILSIEFIGLNANIIPLKFISINNQECKVRPGIRNANSNEALFYPYSMLIN